jgi:hypothetical protein
MRRYLSALFIALVVGAIPDVAPAYDPGSTNCGFYINRDGQSVPRPCGNWRNQPTPQGASARCRDGTYSFSRHHSGTCSRHGGVAGWER